MTALPLPGPVAEPLKIPLEKVLAAVKVLVPDNVGRPAREGI